MRNPRDLQSDAPILSPVGTGAPAGAETSRRDDGSATWVLSEIDLATGFAFSRLRFEPEPVVES